MKHRFCSFFIAVSMIMGLISQNSYVLANESQETGYTYDDNEDSSVEMVSSESALETTTEIESEFWEKESITETEETDSEEVSEAITEDSIEYPELLEEIEKMNSEQSATNGAVDEEAAVYSSDSVELEAIEDVVRMGISGAYYTETAEKILTRLNAIRYEACKNGYIYEGKKLTLADYVPLKWSSDLEEIARIRAAEAAIRTSHDRPNNQSCFSVVTKNGISSYGENLAWNWDGMMYGINQWYEEKDTYVNGGSGQTGHYKNIINPGYQYVAVACFRTSSNDEWYGVSQEFSYNDRLDETKDSSTGATTVNIEIAVSALTSVKVSGAPKYVEQGKSGKISATGTASLYYSMGGSKSRSGKLASVPWTSSNTDCLTIDSEGNWNSCAVGSSETGYVNVSFSAGKCSATEKIYVYNPENPPVIIESPSTTVYVVGEKMSYKGGSITNVLTEKTYALSSSNTKGFDSSTPGLKELSVTADGLTGNIKILVIDKPEFYIEYGRNYGDISNIVTEYGTIELDNSYDQAEKVGNVGKKSVTCNFKVSEAYKGILSDRTGIAADLYVTCDLNSGAVVTFTENEISYRGVAITPALKITSGGNLLIEGTDYTLTYTDNVEVGEGKVEIKGIGCYTGTIVEKYSITPATLVIAADDKRIMTGSEMPGPDFYTYSISGLYGSDKLIAEPVISCDVVNLSVNGVYDITCSNADAGKNYSIEYKKGRLIVAGENVSYSVELITNGHGSILNGNSYVAVNAGSLIPVPNVNAEAGYKIEGWYTDCELTKPWDFSKNIVQSDIKLYAAWGRTGAEDFIIRDVDSYEYSGKQIKPQISVYDGDVLLKSGRDYKIAYYNNINANADGKLTKGNGTGADFSDQLPYFVITGRGNYAGELKQNFDILPASIGDGGIANAGVTLKISDQIVVNARKAQKVFASAKYKKNLVVGKDIELTLVSVKAFDDNNEIIAAKTVMTDSMIPAGFSGTYKLTITGIGNYSGKIVKEIYVSDKQHLISNSVITLGKNLKNVKYAGKAMVFTPGYYDVAGKTIYTVDNGTITEIKANQADVFTVRCANTYLIYGKDYEVGYSNNTAVGTATMTIIGKGYYQGTKSVSFRITGEPFNAANITVEGLTDSVYSGDAITQNNARLTWKKGTSEERVLEYGKDYTITYTSNVTKGNASVTFIGSQNAGFSGKVVKKFKIAALSIEDTSRVKQGISMNSIVVKYDKAGAKPADRIELSTNGIRLKQGTDYTVSYKNNKKLAKNDGNTPSDKMPVMIIKGKGNYTGTLTVTFSIIEKDYSDASMKFEVVPVAYAGNKKDDYEYKPAVKVKDGNVALSAKEYTVTYNSNTQSEVREYMEAILSGKTPAKRPTVTISAVYGSGYTSQETVQLDMPVYNIKMSAANVIVVADNANYTGSQCRPDVRVYYSADQAVVKEAKKCTTEEQLLAAGMKKVDSSQYTVSYGANTVAGRNKGVVTVTGKSPYFGGSVSTKFTINSRNIIW